MDVIVNNEIYQARKIDGVFIPRIEYVSIIVNVKASIKDTHFPCINLIDYSPEEIIKHILQRHNVEKFYKETKLLGLGKYRLRKREAALTHARLISLVYTLLDVLRRGTSKILYREDIIIY